MIGKHIKAVSEMPPAPEIKISYTYEQAAAATGLSVRKWEQLVSKGKIAASYSAGRRPVLLADTIYKFLKDGEVLKNT